MAHPSPLFPRFRPISIQISEAAFLDLVAAKGLPSFGVSCAGSSFLFCFRNAVTLEERSMRLNRLTVYCLCVALLAMAAPTLAQDFRGRINGTVTDNTGAVLPGVTVTATSPALIQPQVQVTGSDGSYRFIALPPGVYEIGFELGGFQSIKREGVRVVINQTLSVDQQMNVATLQETVTVTGASPIVDTSP